MLRRFGGGQRFLACMLGWSSPSLSLPPSFSLAVAGTAAAADVGGDRTGDHGRRGGGSGGIFAASGKLSRVFEGEASRYRNVSEL